MSKRKAQGRKPKEGKVYATGTVVEALSSRLYRLRLLSGGQAEVMAYICGKMAQHKIYLTEGDLVDVELDPYAMNSTVIGRIVWRHRDEPTS